MSARRRNRSWHPLLLSLLLAACPTKPGDGGSQASNPDPADDAAETRKDVATAPEDPEADREAAHHVVFADRTSQAYLLLLPPGPPGDPPTRESLAALVRERLPAAEDEPEVQLLLDLIATEPAPILGTPGLSPEQSETIRHRDLLGLHLAQMPLFEQGQEALIPLDVLRDPVATRALTDAERRSLPERKWVIVLRAHYRNRYGLRGLRLLQTLVRLVALDRGALVYDPDTGETVGVETFTERRLQSSVGNVADQVVVVPFPDPRHGEGFVRLSTRGMRRFGSVDVELDGLPLDGKVLDAATHLLQGLAYHLARAGEYDQEGYAVEVDDVVELEYLDISRAYAGREGRVSRCESCPQRVSLHLVERPAESHDPVEHVVARVVAPRAVSDAPGYDHPAWVRRALQDLLGVP